MGVELSPAPFEIRSHFEADVERCRRQGQESETNDLFIQSPSGDALAAVLAVKGPTRVAQVSRLTRLPLITRGHAEAATFAA